MRGSEMMLQKAQKHFFKPIRSSLLSISSGLGGRGTLRPASQKAPKLYLTLADLFLYSYENEFLDKLIKEGKRKLARRFNLSYRYIDDLISFNNKRF